MNSLTKSKKNGNLSMKKNIDQMMKILILITIKQMKYLEIKKKQAIRRADAHDYEKKIQELCEKIEILEKKLKTTNDQKYKILTQMKDLEEDNEKYRQQIARQAENLSKQEQEMEKINNEMKNLSNTNKNVIIC